MRRRALAILAAPALATACSFHFRNEDGLDFLDVEHATKEESVPLELEPGGTLRIDEMKGGVRVRTDPGAAPRVEAKWTATAKKEEEAHALLERSRVTVEKIAGGEQPGIRLGCKSSDPVVEGVNRFFLWTEVDLTITIPADVTLKIGSHRGNVAVDGPVRAAAIDMEEGDVRVVDAGEIRVTTRRGKIDLDRIRGSVEASSEYDAIEIVDAEGPELVAKSHSGAVMLRSVRADHVDLESSYGELTLDHVAPRGRALEIVATTSNGAIEARDVSGALEVANASGAIRVSDLRGELRARSEYGDVDVDGQFSALDVEAESSGEIRVVARPGSRVATPWRIEAHYGDVRVDLPHDLDAELEAATEYGKITGDFDVRISGSTERGRAHAKLGAGGKSINVSTRNSDVRVLRR
jgi:DUF4097 and DUF4098 domain-containing protein YvlB